MNNPAGFDSLPGWSLLNSGSEATWAAAVTTAATATATLVLSFVDLQRAPVEILAIQRLHGARGIGVRHLNKSESPRATGVAIVDQGYLLYRAVRRKQRANAVFRGREREISNIQFSQCNKPYRKNEIGRNEPADWFAPSFARVRDFGRRRRVGSAGAKGRQAERVRSGLHNTATGAVLLDFRSIRVPGERMAPGRAANCV